MTRDTLVAILARAEGVTATGNQYRAADGHELTLYLGEHGQVTVLRDVASLELLPAFVEIRVREPESAWYVPVEAINALSSRVSKDRSGRRTGFG